MSLPFRTIEWIGDSEGHLRLLDQTRLPSEVAYLDCRAVEDVWHAIKRLSVRGAPAIGIAAAYGVCLTSQNNETAVAACNYLATSRPTAVNLFYALDRMRTVIGATDASDLGNRLLTEALAIHDEDCQNCAAIARNGADLLADLPDGTGILTHCNTGALAMGGEGTALAIVFELHRRGKRIQVFADETRPLLQGARLTTWECAQAGIDCTLICDSMAAQVMREGRIQAVIVGADRVAASGDVANKIGTYGLAVLAKAHDIPFYVAAATTTFDPSAETGADIPIEERAAEEITNPFGKQITPKGVAIYNPAFDVTPAELIAGIITERGIDRPNGS